MNASSTNSEASSSPDLRRRDFLTLFAGAAAICAVPIAGGIAGRRHPAPSAATAVPPFAGLPRLADFERHLGTSFVAAATESQSEIRFILVKAEAVKMTRTFEGEQFSLCFDAPAGHRIESRIYELDHPVLGNLEVFISPVGSPDRFGSQQKGEAAFSSLVRLS